MHTTNAYSYSSKSSKQELLYTIILLLVVTSWGQGIIPYEVALVFPTVPSPLFLLVCEAECTPRGIQQSRLLFSNLNKEEQYSYCFAYYTAAVCMYEVLRMESILVRRSGSIYFAHGPEETGGSTRGTQHG